MTIKEFGNELLMTFSSKKSLFSSKKIERFVAFSLAILMITIYFFLRVTCHECVERFTTTDVIWLTGTVLAYAGYSMAKSIQEKKEDETP